MFRACFALLKPGGVFYAADFCQAGAAPLTAEDRRVLRDEVYCTSLATHAGYRAELEDAGFVVESVDDVSADWRAFTRARAASWDGAAARAATVGACGATVHGELGTFYSLVRDLLAAGRVGGLVVVARKPGGAAGAAGAGSGAERSPSPPSMAALRSATNW